MKILLTLIFTLSLSAQSARFDSLVTSGIEQIYNLKFNQAEKTFLLVQKDFPKNPAGKFFFAMIDWWRIMMDFEVEKYDDQFYDKLDDVIDMCDDILDKNPKNIDAVFFKGGALGFRGRLKAVREDWLDAALDGKDALPLVYDAFKIDSTNIDIQFGLGIYNYYAEVIPNKYEFIKPFMYFFPKGNKAKGIKQLENTAQNGKYAKYEAQYFLMTLYFSFEENSTLALKYAQKLFNKFPDNPAFEKYIGRIYVKQNNYKKASEIFSKMVEKHKHNKFGYNERILREAYYYIGYYNYQNKNDKEAIKYFRECERLSIEFDEGDTGFLVNSTLYLGMLYDRIGERSKALKKYDEVLDLDEFRNSHERAEKYIAKPFR